MKAKKLGCKGCPICGTGDCREDGLPEDCTNHIGKRIKAQYPNVDLRELQLSWVQKRSYQEGF